MRVAVVVGMWNRYLCTLYSTQVKKSSPAKNRATVRAIDNVVLVTLQNKSPAPYNPNKETGTEMCDLDSLSSIGLLNKRSVPVFSIFIA